MSALVDSLAQVDRQLFVAIHAGLANPVFDAVLPVVREKKTWFALYVIFLVLVLRQHRRRAWIPVLAVVAAVALSDQLSGIYLKEMFERVRPCRDPQLVGHIRDLIRCSGAYSLPSAHASNHFAVALALSSFLPKPSRALPLLLMWAGLISFAQVYVGVHYPGDVLVGGSSDRVSGCWSRSWRGAARP